MSDEYSFLHLIDNGMKAAVFQRFSGIFDLTDQNRDLVFQPKVITERKIAEKRGQTSVEFISLWRSRVSPDWSRQRTSVARDGMNVQYTDSTKSSIVNIKAVPIGIDYELRFWSHELDDITHAIESYMKWFQDFPNLIINYQDLYEMDMYMKFGDCVDETDYNIYEKGLYYVSQMPIHLDGWVLTTINAPTILTILVNLYLREMVRGQNQDTLLHTYTITASS